MDSTTKDLIRAYLEKAEQKLAVARRLLASGDFDDSVSRAYYAAFHAVRALLLTAGQNPATHHGAVTLFNLFFIKTGKFERELGRFFTNLKDDRETADYELFANVDLALAETAIGEAVRLLEDATTYLRREGFID
ncbi:MAG: HEPN domain-containing protein [Spirochaetia bacterium]